MRSVSTLTSNYLQARQGIVERTLVYFIATNRSTGGIEPIGFWNELYTADVNVINGQTGLPQTRQYIGGGTLINVGEISLVSDLTIQRATVSLSQINDDVAQAVRGYDLRLAHCEIHVAWYDIATRKLVDTPYPHFVGQVNRAPIPTATAGQEATIDIECVSRTRELTLVNPRKRSDETQKLRSNDRFRRYSNVAGQWAIFWGEEKS